MESKAKDSKFPPKNLHKQRFHRKSPVVKLETSPEELSFERKRKTSSLSLLYPPPRPPLAIVKPTPKIEFDDTKLKGEISVEKHCKCKQSSCVKMYCLCFASGKYCNGCRCSNCQNNVENEEVRQDALGLILQRNQKAFRTMIISSPECSQDHKEKMHPKLCVFKISSVLKDIPTKETETMVDGGRDALILIKYIGCCCKRSQCTQGYCECYQANIFCSESCKCKECKNFKRCEETLSKKSKKFKGQENFLDSNEKDQLNCTPAQSWPIFRRAATGPLNLRFRSLLADIIRLQNLTEFCELLIVTSKAVKVLSDKINPLNLENPSHEQTVKNSAAQIENQDKGPDDQGPKLDNHLSGIQVDVICKDSTSDANIQKERPMSPETLALMSDRKDMLFHPDASSDMDSNWGCCSDVYIEQEKLVLLKLLDFLNSLITSGNAKKSELSARAKRENTRENVIHNCVLEHTEMEKHEVVESLQCVLGKFSNF